MNRERETYSQPVSTPLKMSVRRPSSLLIDDPRDARRLFDQTEQMLRDRPDEHAAVRSQLDQLFCSLRHWRLSLPAADWQQLAKDAVEHTVREQLHQDPFTARAWQKPREYAGDAVMMDFIYSREESLHVPEMTETGRRVFDYTTSAPASRGVRERRRTIASMIDETARNHSRAHVLAVAAGHFREAMLSRAIRGGQLARVVALDADPRSIREVQSCYGQFGVEGIVAKAEHMLTGRVDVGQFDLIYSLGLFDYLPNKWAQRLVERMFRMVLPGGRLVVANFLPGVHDVGYMETFMAWNLIYRDKAAMTDLCRRISSDELGHCRLYTEENRNIVFLEISRRA